LIVSAIRKTHAPGSGGGLAIDRRAQHWRRIVNDEIQLAPPLVYEDLDRTPDAKSAAAEVSDAVKEAIRAIKNAMETARKPGMPLSILSNVAREAPLGSLLVAFLLGIAVARRSRR
jgi:hypothetical protein